MNSICLSVAPNLRCQELTTVEHVVLIVPPVIELIFSFTLAVTSASVEGKNRWILALDGVTFFLLALTDFLAHIIPSISSSVHAFSIVDTVLAAASVLPLLFYTVFLFLFARRSLIPSLPTRFSRIVAFSLFVAIPATLATNELSSLIGIAHTSVPAPNHAPVVEVGFSTHFHQRLSLFFSATCLVLLTLFQLLLFMLAFVRVARGFVDERRIETARREDPRGREEIHLFRGIGWLTAGLKLGAIETAVGFANTSFSVVITRRTLRLFARGTVIIGVMKGLNIVDDISSLESALRARSTRLSKALSRRLMISNPRTSTYQELSPDASSFHAAQLAKREKHGRMGPSPLALGGESNMAKFNDPRPNDSDSQSRFNSSGSYSPVFSIAQSSTKTNQRVTVHYDGKTPPVLQLRFSAVDMDVPPLPLTDNQNNIHGYDNNYKNGPLAVVPEDPREDQVSLTLSGSEWDQHLSNVPQIVPLPRTTVPIQAPPRPDLLDPGRASYAALSPTSDVAMPFRDTDHDIPRASFDTSSSSITAPSESNPSPSRDSTIRPIPSASRERPSPSPRSPFHDPDTTHTTSRSGWSIHHSAYSISARSARTTSGASAASDSLDAVREIVARFPGPPPRVLEARAGANIDNNNNTQIGAGGVHPLGRPPGLILGGNVEVDAADTDSDAEWRELARERSFRRRREMEAHAQRVQHMQQTLGSADAVPRTTDISPVNSIKRKPVPSVDADKEAQARGQAQGQAQPRAHVREVDGVAEVEEAIVARAAQRHTYSSSVEDPPSCYSSEDDGSHHEDDDWGYSETAVRNGETGEVTPKPGTPATSTTVVGTPGPWGPQTSTTAGVTPGLWNLATSTTAAVTPGPWTPATSTTAVVTPGPWTPASSTVVALTPGLGTPASWAGKDGRPIGQDAGRVVAVDKGKNPNPYGSTQALPRLHSSQQPPQKQPQTRARSHSEPQPHHQGGSVNDDESLEGEHRLHRLTLLRRELRAALEPQSQLQTHTPPPPPWLHTDPLTQLQSIDTIGAGGAALHDVADEDEDADAVLDDAWRRAGLARRIKSVSRVRVHTTPRIEHGFDVRGSLVAVEEEDEDEDCVSVTQVEGPWRSASVLKKPARIDSEVLGEENRTFSIRQSNGMSFGR